MQGAPFSREHARLAARPFCMRGREEALASCCSCPGLRHVGQLCRGAPAGEQGRREAWALGLLVPREQEIGAEQEHVEAGGAGDAGRRAGARERVRCKRSR